MLQIVTLSIFGLLCAGALFRPVWALALALLMYPLEQALQGTVPIFRDIPPLANFCVAGVVGVSAVLAVLRQQRPFLGYFSAVWWVLIVLHAWIVISLLWTPSLETAWNMTRDGLPYMVLFVLAAPILIDSIEDIGLLSVLLLVFGSLTAMCIVISPEFSFYGGRLTLKIASNVRTNVLAIGELGGMLVIVAALYRGERGKYLMVGIRAVALIIGAVLALYSGSRGQVLFAAFCAVLCFPMARKQRSVSAFFGTTVGVIAVVVTMAVAASLVLEGDMVKRWTDAQLSRGAMARELNFTELFFAWLPDPVAWIFGLGFNAFTSVTKVSHEPYSHNIMLDALCELGLPIFALLCWGLWLTFQAGRSLFRYVKDWPAERASTAILLALALYQFLLANKQGSLWGAGLLFLHMLLIVRLNARTRLEEPGTVDLDTEEPEVGVADANADAGHPLVTQEI